MEEHKTHEGRDLRQEAIGTAGWHSDHKKGEILEGGLTKSEHLAMGGESKSEHLK